MGKEGAEGQGRVLREAVCSITIAIRFNLSQAYRIALNPGVLNVTSVLPDCQSRTIAMWIT
ncbi:hypothetical protein H6F86_13120 [Phormidium sp. FACHB-592]|uniref:Uncharacterized protein n=1 Tax=Stenomitos frigidus AS-A4 TaxID=2933935 RepID=A0ABV0KJ74_9CYAN|nr:hypothetical protein [Phormidium sp. FACHB-592]MBD2074816.1 hypothetical protein [Phormidium sp. FACHB-592]